MLNVVFCCQGYADLEVGSHETYNMPESFYARIFASRSAQKIHDIPIYLMAGSEDSEKESEDVIDAKYFETELKKYTPKVQSWYPAGGYERGNGHLFSGEIQREMVYRIKQFIEKLNQS